MMSTINDRTAAAASRMEHQILEHVKQALRVTLDWKVPAVGVSRKISSIQFTLKSFQRHLERLMAIEENGGYLDVVADTKPNLQHRIDKLAHDHDHFRQSIAEIMPHVEELCEWQTVQFNEACEEIRDLLDEVDQHDQEEINLLQESLLWDEGGEG